MTNSGLFGSIRVTGSKVQTRYAERQLSQRLKIQRENTASILTPSTSLTESWTTWYVTCWPSLWLLWMSYWRHLNTYSHSNLLIHNTVYYSYSVEQMSTVKYSFTVWHNP